MKIAAHQISWQDPNDPSVVAHRVYYLPEGGVVDIDNTPSVIIDMPVLQVDLATLPIQTNGENYSLYLVAIDNRGNESNLSPEKIENLDSTPPAAPTWI